jgi:hypothetical protein
MRAVKTALTASLLFISSSLIAAEDTPAAESAAIGNSLAASATSTNATAVLAVAATNSPAEKATNDVPVLMDVRIKVESGPGQIAASRAYITVATNRFAFLVPGGFKVDSSDPQRITLIRADLACILSLRILEPTSEQGLTVEECRNRINKERPGCKIEGEFYLGAGNSSGPAFELRWESQGLRRAARLAYVPFRAGVVEFCLDSSPEKFGSMQTFLNDIMLTFRASDPSGNLEATPLYDKI